VRALSTRRGSDINLRSEPQKREYREIVATIVSNSHRRVLDWGCGWGLISHLLREEGVDVTAFDYHPEIEGVTRMALERFPEIEVHTSSDPVHLPFESRSFDAVLSLGVLEHVAYPNESLEELKRVLEPDGTLYVYKLPNRYSYLERVARLLGLYYHGSLPNDAVYTRSSAVALVEAHGFRVVESRQANMLPLTLDGAVATRAAGAIWHANQMLSRVPVLNVISTNVELVAVAPPWPEPA
jgi:2-polyprenyl-3-methyl-5-hydroxy-6-metoxy-1,4-benzoquinol methylase